MERYAKLRCDPRPSAEPMGRCATCVIALWVMVLTLLFSATLQAAGIHRCDDDKGGHVFQDRPCPGEVVVPAQGKHFIWQATSAKGTLYLLGSIHFGSRAMYPLPAVMTSAFAQSEALVVEANVLDTDPLRLAQLVAEKAIYRDGTTLQQHLSPATWRRLNEVAASLNLPVQMLGQQKPWFVSMTLTALALNRFGYSEELGIDRYFLRQAQGRKKIIELEGLEWQLSLFDRLTDAEQVAMLEQTLSELNDGKLYYERIFAAWKSGDADGVQALFDEESSKEAGADRLNQILLIERNRSMTDTLEKLANAGGRYFVVVGAGHLSGDEGIIALLKQRGYQVSQH